MCPSYFRLVVDEAEEALRREQTRVLELQQQLEQERAVSLRKDREEEERRGVRSGLINAMPTNCHNT